MKINKLTNGLRYVMVENPSSELVSLQIWIKCGSVNERKKEYGVSHFIEHLLFKGTRHHKVGEVAGKIESLGGDLNAFTSKEYTCYYVTVPSMYFDEALDTLDDLVFYPTFDESEIKLEREVIIEEIKRYQDIPGSIASDNYFDIHFKGHPYARTVLGSEAVIRNISREEILNYYKRFYSIGNALLVICGNVKKADTEKRIKKVFNDIPRTAPNKIELDNVKMKTNFVSKVENMDVKEAVFEFGFPIPGLLHKDVPALDVLSIILGQGESSRLFKALRLEKGLVTGIGSYAYTPKYGGSFSTVFSMDNTTDLFNDNFRETIKCIGEEINKIRREGVTEEEVNKAKVILLSDKIYERETVDGLARKIGHLISVTGDVTFEDGYFKQLKKVDTKAVVSVLNRYLKVKGVSVSGVVSKTTLLKPSDIAKIFKESLTFVQHKGPTVTKTAKYKKSPMDDLLTSSQYDFDKKFLISRPEIFVHDSGAKIITRKMTSAPIISMRIIIPGGTILETEENQGVSNLLSRTLVFGAGELSFMEIAGVIDGTASTLDAFSGRNSIGLNLEVMKPFLGRMLDVTEKVLLEPKFNKEYFDVEKKLIEDEIRSTEDNLAQYVNMLLLRTIYKKHPYRFEAQGTVDSIKRLTRDKVIDFYRSLLIPNKMVFSVVGDLDKEHIIKWVDGLVSKIRSKDTKFPNIEPEPEQDSPRVNTFKKESKQAHIFLAYKTCDIRSKDRYPLKVLSSLLSGQSGRLFVNLRDRQSLAYTVAPVDMFGADPGYFGVYIASETSKTKQAIDEIRKEMNRIKTEKIGKEELERAKNFIIGRHAIGMQTYGEQSSNMGFDEFYGLGFDSVFSYSKQVLDVTAEDIMNVARKYFKDSRENLAIVSDVLLFL